LSFHVSISQVRQRSIEDEGYGHGHNGSHLDFIELLRALAGLHARHEDANTFEGVDREADHRPHVGGVHGFDSGAKTLPGQFGEGVEADYDDHAQKENIREDERESEFRDVPHPGQESKDYNDQHPISPDIGQVDGALCLDLSEFLGVVRPVEEEEYHVSNISRLEYDARDGEDVLR